jgi:hypothetical protein
LNFSARRHPVNKLRRDQLLAELVADYQPNTTLLRATCEHLAGTLEQLETMRSGSPDWGRLIDKAQTLGAALHEARATAPSTNDPPLDDDALIARLETLLAAARANRDAKLTSTQPLADDSDVVREPGKAGDAVPPRESPASAAVPAADVTCPYCRRSACLGADHPEFRVLHWDDPDEVKRRDQEATAIMLHQIGKPLPDY